MRKWHCFYLKHLVEFSSGFPASIPLGECISYFYVPEIKLPNQYKEEDIYFGSQLQRVAGHHGEEGMAERFLSVVGGVGCPI